MLTRVKDWCVAALSGTLHVAVVLVALTFGLGQCVGGAKNMLSCVGVSRTSQDPEVGVRQPDESNANDLRMMASLLRMAQCRQLDPEFIRVAIIESQEVNAATIGGSAFLLFDGLERATDQQLDAVMAHEVAHDVLGHIDQTLERASTVANITNVLGALVGAEPTAREEVYSWATALTLPCYSREQEIEADAEAVRILRDAGYDDPTGVFRNTLSWLRACHGESGGGFLDSHPSVSERLELLATDGASPP